MKPMKPMKSGAAFGLTMAMMASASAQIKTTDTFGSGPNTFTIDFVTVGNPGNPEQSASNRSHSESGGDGFGSVPYVYRMGTYEISVNNIRTATAAGMTNVYTEPVSDDRPVEVISWYDAAAFVNWLNTSQGYQAAYNLTYSSSWSMTLWSSANAWQLGGENLYRHKDAIYFLPSDNEWYKSAYYSPVGSNYFLYATGSDTPPTAAIFGGTAEGTAVYNSTFALGPANANQSGGLSPYGTRGQSGNVWELMESAFVGINDNPTALRVIRGGSYEDSAFGLRSTSMDAINPALRSYYGFRVASVPEASSAFLMVMGLGALLLRRRSNHSL